MSSSAEAEALALQDQLQPRPAAPGVEPLLARADRRQQLLGLVEAQGARRHAELGAHLADGVKVVGHERSSIGGPTFARTMPGGAESAQGEKLTFASR